MTDTTPRAEIHDEEGKESETHRLRFEYVTSRGFRVIHVDGAWGGLRPDMNVHLSMYSERSALPESITLEVDPDELGEEQIIHMDKSDSIVREVDVCAVMDLSTAQALRDWLDRMLDLAEKRLSGVDSQESQE